MFGHTVKDRSSLLLYQFSVLMWILDFIQKINELTYFFYMFANEYLKL